jgi:hypothetical protein
MSHSGSSSGEIHLFVLWQHARGQERRILEDVARHFRILGVFDVRWPRRSFEANLKRLYGHRIADRPGKARHCGSGPFLVIVFLDEAPRYDAAKRSRNANVLARKVEYRRWTGGGFRVHASDNRRHSPQHLYLLLGRTVDSFDAVRQRGWDGVTVPLERSTPGDGGWPSREALWTALDVAQRHVVLHERVPDEDGPDFELLVDDVADAVEMLGGRRVPAPAAGGFRVAVEAGGAPLCLELRAADDGSFDRAWAEALLGGRVEQEGLLVVPATHRRAVALRRRGAFGAGQFDDAERLELESWMCAHGYAATVPLDRRPVVDGLAKAARRRAQRLRTWLRSWSPVWLDLWLRSA